MHYASRLTGWNAIKQRAEQLQLPMTDAQVKACTAKIVALGDVRALALNDVDDIIRDWHRGLIRTGGAEAAAPPSMSLTPEERRTVVEKEKRVLADDEEDAEAAAAVPEPAVKRAKVDGITA